MSANYKEAGVDIDAGNDLVERIKPFVKGTTRSGVMGSIGGFGGMFDLKATGKFNDPILVSGTDGVGTKLKLAQKWNKHGTIGQDLVAMCVNDIAVQGAEPLFFLDYFACGKLDIETAESVIKGIADGCKISGCALIGGETAEMPGMYSDGEYDLAGFTVGAVERDEVLPKLDSIKEGDIILGLASSGIHSNGYSLVRHVLDIDNLDEATQDALIEPTKIYVKECLALKDSGALAFAHITGGGLTENIPRVLPDNISAEIDLSTWEMPAIFKKIQGNQIEEAEMLKTFNCGIGMVAIVSADFVIPEGVEAIQIGKIVNGNCTVKYV